MITLRFAVEIRLGSTLPPVRYVPYVLAVFGVGMIVGNLIGSWLADRALTRTIGALLLWNAVVLGLFSITAGHVLLLTMVVLLVGTGVAIVPALQIRLMDVAQDAQTLAAALNHYAFNIVNALGAWLGALKGNPITPFDQSTDRPKSWNQS